MQKRKFDELISHFNRKVSDMGIDQKYKMELLGMISAIGFAHEKELSTNLAEVGTDCISRQAAIELVKDVCDAIMSGCESWYDPETEDEVYTDIREVDAILKCNKEVRIALRNMPSTQPEHIRGHWICDRSWSEGVGMGESYGHYWKCDKCGHLEQGDWGECGCNFCSNCGSDNREVTE